jgi:hypothetical protein
MARLDHQTRTHGLKSELGCGGLGTTVTIQRVGVLDLSSSTARTTPVTGNPSMVNLVFSPRYWA